MGDVGERLPQGVRKLTLYVVRLLPKEGSIVS